MPYPTEHSCRLKSPDLFEADSFRRIKQGNLSIIIGRLKGATTTTTQAYRYNKDEWSEVDARAHCGEANGAFESATGEEKMVDIEAIDSISKAYAMHNKIHADYVDARWGRRRKVEMQADHEAVVRRILALGGRHLIKGEALDETLSDDLKGAFKLRYLTDGVALVEGTNRSTVQILRTGIFHHPAYGKFTITQDILDTMVVNFHEHRPKSPTELVVDWEHLSSAEPPQKAPAAGWVKDVTTTEGKLFAEVEWTEQAVGEIGKGEYRFISPEFNLHYKDKETGKDIGATLLSVALTNRPFIEGMSPVMLSERLADNIFMEDTTSYEERWRRVRSAYDKEFGTPQEAARRDWVVEIYDAYCIVERLDGLYRLPYTVTDDIVTFDKLAEVKVEKQYVEIQLTEQQLAEWTVAYINDLPDSAFAYIESGGEKDEDGKTVPRALRNLPYRDKDGKVDLPHLRNALSRLPQTDLTPEEQAKARKVLISAAQEAGVGEYSELPNVTEEQWAEAKKLREEERMDKELRKLLGLGEDADLIAAVSGLKAKADEAATNLGKVTDLETKVAAADKRAVDAEAKLTSYEVSKLVDDAIAAGRILPKQKAWATDYALKDRTGFDAYLLAAEHKAPSTVVLGADGEPLKELTEQELAIAAKLGVSREALIKAKETK
jgi:phage I-like protein